MATVNDVTNQIDQDGQYPKDDEFKLNALNSLYEQYKQFKGNKTFIEWLDRYTTAFNQGTYDGYSKAELMTAARTYANKYPVVNGITNGTKTLTQEGRAGDSTSVNERSNRDLPSEENGITNGETAENAQQPTTNTTESSTIGDNPENQEDNTPPTNEQNTEEIEANQEPGGPGTMEPSYVTRGKAVFQRLSDITSNMNNNNQEPAPVREEEKDMTEDENIPPSSTTTTTSTSTPVQEEEKTPTPAPARTNTPAGQPAEMVARSGTYEPEEPAIRLVDRGRFDYIRNNGWGSNSSILTRMGYSPEEIRRILDNSGAVRPEYFSY